MNLSKKIVLAGAIVLTIQNPRLSAMLIQPNAFIQRWYNFSTNLSNSMSPLLAKYNFHIPLTRQILTFDTGLFTKNLQQPFSENKFFYWIKGVKERYEKLKKEKAESAKFKREEQEKEEEEWEKIQDERYKEWKKEQNRENFGQSTGETHYQVLGIKPTATPQEIKHAWRNLAKKYHPDLHQKESPVQQKEYKETIQKINTAYMVLSDPKNRVDYDKKLQKNAAHTASNNPTTVYDKLPWLPKKE